MSTERLYRKAERADDIGDLDLLGADQKEIIDRTYDVWFGDVNPVIKELRDFNPLYKLACRIVRPFKVLISGTLTDRDFSAAKAKRLCKEEWAAGLYVSAVLNETDAKRLYWGDFPYGLDSLGCDLKEGKTLCIIEGGPIDVRYAGSAARGGTVINDRKVYGMGDCARDGIFINKRHCETMGEEARGGIFVNIDCADQMGNRATGGLFVDYDRSHNIDGKVSWRSARTRYEKNGATYQHDALNAEKDEFLRKLMDRMEEAAMKEKIADVKETGRKIDAHLRKTYKPRKIA
jgi:hypothetical protein